MSNLNEMLKLAKNIKQEIKKGVPEYHTGLLGEQMIVASYQTMDVEKLEKLRFILNKIIKKKKEYLRVKNAQTSTDTIIHNGMA